MHTLTQFQIQKHTHTPLHIKRGVKWMVSSGTVGFQRWGNKKADLKESSGETNCHDWRDEKGGRAEWCWEGQTGIERARESLAQTAQVLIIAPLKTFYSLFLLPSTFSQCLFYRFIWISVLYPLTFSDLSYFLLNRPFTHAHIYTHQQ